MGYDKILKKVMVQNGFTRMDDKKEKVGGLTQRDEMYVIGVYTVVVRYVSNRYMDTMLYINGRLYLAQDGTSNVSMVYNKLRIDCIIQDDGGLIK